jgi:predicted nucleic acid-binding protein
MTADVFVDTNILLYFISKSPDEREKSARAADILMRDDCGLSTQVLAEFYVNATLKSAFRLPHQQVMNFLDTLKHIPTAALGVEEMHAAADLAHHRKLSFWDAAIIIAAQSLACTKLYTEDLQHGQRFGSLRVVNPFLDK